MRNFYRCSVVLMMVFLITNAHTLETIHVFDAIVKPVFASNCTACHNSEDLQGGLDLSTVEGIQQAGPFGPVIQPGSADVSELVQRMILPEEDELVMPPSGKERVREENIKIIRWWIDAGASFNQHTDGTDAPDDIRDILIKKIEDEKNRAELTSLNPASPKDLQSLRDHGFEVRELAVGHPLVDVSIDPLTKQISKEEISSLSKISNNIAWLNLSRCGLTDELLKQLSAMQNLSKINLSQNSITAQSLQQLKASPNIETINLYQTKIGDDAVQVLVTWPNLRTVYLWDSKITNDGIKQLKNEKPTIKVIGGIDQ